MESIKASELRIGNWVIVADEWAQVTCISIDGISADSKTASYVFELHEEVKHILLTPEILLKAGISTSYIEQDPKFRLCSDDWGYIVNVSGVDVSHIRFVHQLQNLYYSLVGHELTINL